MNTTALSPIARPLAAAIHNAIVNGRPVRAVGAANALAAKIAADSGFDALWVSGLEVSTALGLPDENVLGPRDLTDAVLTLRRATDLPVIVDIDNAGGAVGTAGRFALDLARAGASAVCLEDSAYPKTNSFSLHRDQGLADLDLIRAQLKEIRAQAGRQTLLIARTETLICGGSLAEAVARADAYVAAGADAVLLHSKDESGEQALSVAKAWPGLAPLVSVPTAFPHLGPDELGAAGYALIIYANQLSRAAMAAMREAADHFHATGAFDTARLASVQDLLQVADPAARACL
ncbi:isocitrate lyase/phosphoenolpyruvate mutase family protein [Kitasatospora sp. NPDC058190]|uniref:isocitrate lyase/phosphoenolpyruvate mutase family protein n=1 Tax=Kitasatospora sp. NPDC058190 TaxID=3346371 RepID=UPI0036DAE4C9